MRCIELHELRQACVACCEITALLRKHNGPRWVELFHKLPGVEFHFVEWVFVAETPHDDAGTILVAHRRGPRASEEGFLIAFVLEVLTAMNKRHFTIHIDAHLIAHLDEARMRRIVRGADKVDIGVADEFQIAAHLLLGGYPAFGPDVMM